VRPMDLCPLFGSYFTISSGILSSDIFSVCNLHDYNVLLFALLTSCLIPNSSTHSKVFSKLKNYVKSESITVAIVSDTSGYLSTDGANGPRNCNKNDRGTDPII
jgi:hypothetical protein